MTIKERVLRALVGGDDDDPTADADDHESVREAVAAPIKVLRTEPVAASPVPDARIEAMEKELAEHRARERQHKLDGIANEAKAFVEAEFAANRLLPADRKAVMTAYAYALLDDAGLAATVSYDESALAVTLAESDAKPVGRVEAIKAIFAGRTPHALTTEQIESAVAVSPQKTQAEDDFDYGAAAAHYYGR